MSDEPNHPKRCPGCGAPPRKRETGCQQCQSYHCGTVVTCKAFGCERSRSRACLVLESKGGWGDE